MMAPDEYTFDAAKALLAAFELDMNKYTQFRDGLYEAMIKGLDLKTRDLSSIKMYPSYVTKIPNGTEKGRFLALVVGSTNYRILLVQMSGKPPPRINERTYTFPNDLMTGTGEEFFDFIAHTVANFLETHGVIHERFNLGMTFSFPCEQRGLSESYLVRWTKGYSVSDVVGKDVTKLLNSAFDKASLKITCVAVVNDTVGTLASCVLTDKNCYIGVIVDLGINASYLEKLANVPLMHTASGAEIDHEAKVIINTECGAYGECGELETVRNEYDRLVDKQSLYPGKQLLDKMCCGTYLGELVRLFCVDLIKRGILFRGNMPERFLQRGSFLIKYISDIERDPPDVYFSTHYVLTEELGVPVVDPIDDSIVRLICEKVSKRSAYLMAAVIAAILYRLKRPQVTVAVDGTLYKFHPLYRDRMAEMVNALKPEKVKYTLQLAIDGSGKGAAIIAAAAMRKTQ